METILLFYPCLYLFVSRTLYLKVRVILIIIYLDYKAEHITIHRKTSIRNGVRIPNSWWS